MSISLYRKNPTISKENGKRSWIASWLKGLRGSAGQRIYSTLVGDWVHQLCRLPVDKMPGTTIRYYQNTANIVDVKYQQMSVQDSRCCLMGLLIFLFPPQLKYQIKKIRSQLDWSIGLLATWCWFNCLWYSVWRQSVVCMYAWTQRESHFIFRVSCDSLAQYVSFSAAIEKKVQMKSTRE